MKFSGRYFIVWTRLSLELLPSGKSKLKKQNVFVYLWPPPPSPLLVEVRAPSDDQRWQCFCPIVYICYIFKAVLPNQFWHIKTFMYNFWILFTGGPYILRFCNCSFAYLWMWHSLPCILWKWRKMWIFWALQSHFYAFKGHYEGQEIHWGLIIMSLPVLYICGFRYRVPEKDLHQYQGTPLFVFDHT